MNKTRRYNIKYPYYFSIIFNISDSTQNNIATLVISEIEIKF